MYKFGQINSNDEVKDERHEEYYNLETLDDIYELYWNKVIKILHDNVTIYCVYDMQLCLQIEAEK